MLDLMEQRIKLRVCHQPIPPTDCNTLLKSPTSSISAWSKRTLSWSSDYQPSAYQRSSILDLLKLSASDQNWTDCSTNTAGACTQFSLADEPTRCQNYLQEYIQLGLKKISPFSFQSLCEKHRDYKCTYIDTEVSAQQKLNTKSGTIMIDQFCCDFLPLFDLSKAEDRLIWSKS